MTLALLFGGKSYEHEISIVSAITLKNILKFKLEFIFCDSNRDFYHIPASSMKVSHFASRKYKKNKALFVEKNRFASKGIFGKPQPLECDVVLNLIHGADGEDGKIAGVFDFYEIPYIGPRLEASVLSFSKVLTKDLANYCGVKTLPFETLSAKKRRLEKLTFPVILKPSKLGSSIGVSIVRDEKTLDYALDVALAYDKVILVEPFIEGVAEYNLAGCLNSNEIEYSIIEAPEKGELLDFDKKYLDFSRSGTVSEALLPDNIKNSIKEAFKKLYEPFFKGALVRCDFFLIDDEVILNEINPCPGSMAHYLFSDFNGVIERLIEGLPELDSINVSYNYIDTIHSAKGKASYR